MYSYFTDPSKRPHGQNLVRLLSFIPGKILHAVPYKPELMYKVGQTLGKVSKALQVTVGYKVGHALGKVGKAL